MKNTLETRLGMFVALIAVAAVLIIEILGGIEKFQRGYRLHARFDTVQELKIGDRVKMAGVEVGRVEDIALATNKVIVTMKLRAGAAVKTDSTATIKFTGLLGQNFVSIDFGSPAARRLDDDQYVATAEQPDLSALMAEIHDVATGVTNLTGSFTGIKIDKLVGPLMDLLEASRDSLTVTISNMQSVSSQIAQGKGTVGKLIYDDSLYTSALNTVSNLQRTSDEIKLTIADARKVIDDVNAGQGTLGKLVKDETLYTEATATMRNFREISDKINQGQGTVGKLINDQEFYKNAKLTLQKVNQATEGLEDQGPLSVLGVVAGKLF